MRSRSPLFASALLRLFVVHPAAIAQAEPQVTLANLLQRLQADLDHYDRRLPSLFCDEHIVSRVDTDRPGRDTVTDSTFRLRRTPGPDGTASLVESRDLKTVNGQPSASEALSGPTPVTGAFEGGLSVISASQAACMHYQLKPSPARHPDQPFLVTFTTALSPANVPSCLLDEPARGRALVDPTSLHILRLEITTPHHTIIPGDAYRRAIVGKRVLTVDYAPTTLAGETFWLPSSVTMQAVGDAGTFRRTTCSYQATYTHYHKLEVTSRILPAPR